jgi:hypothetical protein
MRGERQINRTNDYNLKVLVGILQLDKKNPEQLHMPADSIFCIDSGNIEYFVEIYQFPFLSDYVVLKGGINYLVDMYARIKNIAEKAELKERSIYGDV